MWRYGIHFNTPESTEKYEMGRTFIMSKGKTCSQEFLRREDLSFTPQQYDQDRTSQVNGYIYFLRAKQLNHVEVKP